MNSKNPIKPSITNAPLIKSTTKPFLHRSIVDGFIFLVKLPCLTLLNIEDILDLKVDTFLLEEISVLLLLPPSLLDLF